MSEKSYQELLRKAQQDYHIKEKLALKVEGFLTEIQTDLKDIKVGAKDLGEMIIAKLKEAKITVTSSSELIPSDSDILCEVKLVGGGNMTAVLKQGVINENVIVHVYYSIS